MCVAPRSSPTPRRFVAERAAPSAPSRESSANPSTTRNAAPESSSSRSAKKRARLVTKRATRSARASAMPSAAAASAAVGILRDALFESASSAVADGTASERAASWTFFFSADTKDRPERFLDFSVSVPSSVYIPPVSFAHVTVSAPQKCATCRVSAPESASRRTRHPRRRSRATAPPDSSRAERSAAGSEWSRPAWKYSSEKPSSFSFSFASSVSSLGGATSVLVSRPDTNPSRERSRETRVHPPSRHPRVHGNKWRSRAAYSPTGGPIPSACAVTRARRARASKSATFSGSSSASESKKKGNASLAARRASAKKSASRGDGSGGDERDAFACARSARDSASARRASVSAAFASAAHRETRETRETSEAESSQSEVSEVGKDLWSRSLEKMSLAAARAAPATRARRSRNSRARAASSSFRTSINALRGIAKYRARGLVTESVSRRGSPASREATPAQARAPGRGGGLVFETAARAATASADTTCLGPDVRLSNSVVASVAAFPSSGSSGSQSAHVPSVITTAKSPSSPAFHTLSRSDATNARHLRASAHRSRCGSASSGLGKSRIQAYRARSFSRSRRAVSATASRNRSRRAMPSTASIARACEGVTRFSAENMARRHRRRARAETAFARAATAEARARSSAACLSANEGSAATRDANTVVNASPPQEILAIYFRCLFFPARNASPRVASSVVAGDASVSGLGKSAAIRDIRPGASRVTTKACLERVVVTRVPIPSEHACVLPSRRRTANRSSFVSAWSVSATASASSSARRRGAGDTRAVSACVEASMSMYASTPPGSASRLRTDGSSGFPRTSTTRPPAPKTARVAPRHGGRRVSRLFAARSRRKPTTRLALASAAAAAARSASSSLRFAFSRSRSRRERARLCFVSAVRFASRGSLKSPASPSRLSLIHI